jgi:hypothetical protein
MKHLGDFDASTVVYGKFTTFRPSTGATFTLGGTPALSVYKDNSTTQSTTGVTLTVDFDSVTGLHHFAIDTSADGTFYSAGSFFSIVITTGTVDSVSVVGTVVAEFTIRKNSALKPTTAGRTLDVSATGEAGIDWANIGSPTTAVNLSATNIDVDQVVASVSGAVGSVTGAVGSVTGNVGGNVTGSVGSVATGGISASSFAANAIDAAALAASAVGEIADGVWDEAISGHLGAGSTGAALNAAGSAGDPWTTPLPGAYGSGTAGFIIGTNIDALISSRLASASYTAPLDAAGTATAVWNAATATYGSAGSYGLLIETNVDAQISTRSTLDAAGVRSAVGLASANLDTQFDAIPTATENADALLNRDMSAVSDTNSRSPLNALRFLRNKWSISGTTLTVTKENDASSAWVSTVSTDAAAVPVVGSDPS